MKRTILILLALACLLMGASVLAEEKERETLTLGSKGEAVVRLQQRLMDLGFYSHKPTGSYQAVTRRAVVAYERVAGARQDGKLTPEEQDVLFSSLAPRAVFSASVPLTFTAQGSFQVTGVPMDWREVRPLLAVETAYTVINCATGESCELIFQGGEAHAHMVPAFHISNTQMLTKWLGESNSFYKIGVLVEIESRKVAASLQFDGAVAHVYFAGSTSEVRNLPDAEHDSLIRRAAGR